MKLTILLLVLIGSASAQTATLGKLVVYRLPIEQSKFMTIMAWGDHDYMDRHNRWAVLCDGKKVSEKLRVNQYVEIPLSEGKHACKVTGIGLSTGKNPLVDIQVTPSATVYARMMTTPNGSRWTLQPATEEEALAAIQQIKANTLAKPKP
jgi:hypothetical protein